VTALELAALLIAAATQLKAAGMELEKDPSTNFNDLATLVSIAYAESGFDTGQSNEITPSGKREKSFGPFQVNKFWYEDHSDSGDVTLVNNEYTDVFNDKNPKEMAQLLQDPNNAAIAAVIIANSNDGYENWSVYNKKVYGIQNQNFDSEYWRVGFNAAAEQFYKITDEEKDVEIEDMDNNDTPKEEKMYPVEGSLGDAMRARGYGDREVVKFNRALNKLIAEYFPGMEDNEEVQRQTTIAAAQSIGMPSNTMSLEERQNLDTVKNVVKDFVYNIGKQKARLGG